MLLGNASLNMARVAVWGRLSCLPAALISMSWSHHKLQFLGHPGLSWPTGPLALTRYLLVAGNASVILAHGDEVAQIKSGTNRLGLRWLERTDMFFYIIWQAPLLERVARLALPTRDRHKSVHGRRGMARDVWQLLEKSSLHWAKAGMVRLIRLQGLSIGKVSWLNCWRWSAFCGFDVFDHLWSSLYNFLYLVHLHRLGSGSAKVSWWLQGFRATVRTTFPSRSVNFEAAVIPNRHLENQTTQTRWPRFSEECWSRSHSQGMDRKIRDSFVEAMPNSQWFLDETGLQDCGSPTEDHAPWSRLRAWASWFSFVMVDTQPT